MYQLYSLLLTLGFLVLLPQFLLDALRHGKYIAGFRERLGSFPPTILRQPVVWLHCVSVGETQAARPLADLIRQRFPEYTLVVSTVTLTGQTLARQVFDGKATRVFYFPFDWRWSVRRTLTTIKPAAVLLMETELWPNFLHECNAQQIPVALINGRISLQSQRRYRLIKNFFRRVVANLDVAIMQTEKDGNRLRSLSFPDEKIFVSGNLKFDAGTMRASANLIETLRKRFSSRNGSGLILAASTHAPEERIILESFQMIRERLSPKPRLMFAPRHPERFGEVASLLKSSGLTWTRRTNPESSTDHECDVVLLDTIGELTAAYALASIVFVGGSLARFGGHNILEPAAMGRCVITGFHTLNFEAIVAAFVKAKAMIRLPPLGDREASLELARQFQRLLTSGAEREELEKRAAGLVAENLGATERTVELIRPLFIRHTRLIELKLATER